MSGGVILILALYFVPAIVAGLRGHHNSGAIFALNLLLGWTLIGWVAAFVWACTATTGVQKRASWSVMGMQERHAEVKAQEREREERQREKAKWARMSSDPLPPVPQLQKQRDLVGPIVIGGLAVIASLLLMGWYFKTSQTTTTVETTSSIPKPQSTVLEGLTPEQIKKLEATRDAIPVVQDAPLPPKKGKHGANGTGH